MRFGEEASSRISPPPPPLPPTTTTAATTTMATPPLFLTAWNDPTFMFSMSALFSVCFVVGKPDLQEPSHSTLLPRDPYTVPGVLWSYLLDPAFFVALVILLVARHLVGDNAKPMTPGVSRRAGWYLWNAVVIHVMMDGMSGGKWGNKLMAENYELLDVRFTPNAARGDAATAVWVVNFELFVHSVLTVVAYVGVATEAAWQHEAEIVALVVQLMGTFAFTLPEFMQGCINMVGKRLL